MKLLTVSTIVFCLSAFAESPNSRAEKIAKESRRVASLLSELVKEVDAIKPDALVTRPILDQTKQILRSRFVFKIAARAGEEAAIKAALKKDLGDKGFEPSEEGEALFPSREPMLFAAAPGGTWGGHHAYPGGLVYHTFTITKFNLGTADVYRRAYDVRLNRNLLKIAALWHDIAKTWSITWTEDGSCTKNEGSIGGTSRHHIFGVAEALARDFPPALVVTIAGAHDPLADGMPGYETVVGYLRAAAIIAGKPLSAAGLETRDGKVVLIGRPELAPLVNHLGDADWVITVPAMQFSRARIEEVSKGTHWDANRLLSSVGEVFFYDRFKNADDKTIKQWIASQTKVTSMREAGAGHRK